MDYLYMAIAALGGYLLGSVNTALVIGSLSGVDIRTKGSGNAGATNAVRVLGKKIGVLVFLGDFIKGILACLIGWLLFQNQLIAGVFAVVGHVFPLYYGFKGGKGVSTVLGVLLFLDWKIFLVTGIVMLLLIGLTKIVSISTLTGLVVMCILFFVLHKGAFLLQGGVIILTFLIFITHRANIKRLLNGTENKFGKKNSGKADIK